MSASTLKTTFLVENICNKNAAGFHLRHLNNSGEPPEARTPDPLIKSQMLCQLS